MPAQVGLVALLLAKSRVVHALQVTGLLKGQSTGCEVAGRRIGEVRGSLGHSVHVVVHLSVVKGLPTDELLLHRWIRRSHHLGQASKACRLHLVRILRPSNTLVLSHELLRVVIERSSVKSLLLDGRNC